MDAVPAFQASSPAAATGMTHAARRRRAIARPQVRAFIATDLRGL
jgi:hypothetical protein